MFAGSLGVCVCQSNCVGKACGDADGCGGCARGDMCLANAVCNPADQCDWHLFTCVGCICGADERCGGFRARAPALVLADVCTGWGVRSPGRDCVGKACGDADGCGGQCVGTCVFANVVCNPATSPVTAPFNFASAGRRITVGAKSKQAPPGPRDTDQQMLV